MDLYYSTNGEGWWDSTGWLFGDPCVNEWYRVHCDEHGGVFVVDIRYNNMTGILSESIGDLFALQFLILANGRIGGTIPSSIINLKTS